MQDDIRSRRDFQIADASPGDAHPADFSTPPTVTRVETPRPSGPVTIRPGLIVDSRYLVEEFLGSGNSGQVWRAKHLGLGADRALKFFLNEPDLLAGVRFRREATLAANLRHPHALVVHHANFEGPYNFIETEFIDGTSLEKTIRSVGAITMSLASRIVPQLCSCLQAAHDLGIIHRDLKPANLMLLRGRPEGEEFLKVVDFGIATSIHSSAIDPMKTRAGLFVGTVAYAAPEHLLGGAEPRSDIYSLGVSLYELLTGRRPYVGTVASILQQVLSGTPRPFRDVSPWVEELGYPPALEALVLRCLARNPDDRPQSARAVAEGFRTAINS